MGDKEYDFDFFLMAKLYLDEHIKVLMKNKKYSDHFSKLIVVCGRNKNVYIFILGLLHIYFL